MIFCEIVIIINGNTLNCKHENKLLTLAVEAPVPGLPGRLDFPCGTVIKDS